MYKFYKKNYVIYAIFSKSNKNSHSLLQPGPVTKNGNIYGPRKYAITYEYDTY